MGSAGERAAVSKPVVPVSASAGSPAISRRRRSCRGVSSGLGVDTRAGDGAGPHGPKWPRPEHP